MGDKKDDEGSYGQKKESLGSSKPETGHRMSMSQCHKGQCCWGLCLLTNPDVCLPAIVSGIVTLFGYERLSKIPHFLEIFCIFVWFCSFNGTRNNSLRAQFRDFDQIVEVRRFLHHRLWFSTKKRVCCGFLFARPFVSKNSACA